MLSCQHFYRTQLVSLVPGKIIVKNRLLELVSQNWPSFGGGGRGKGKILVLNDLCDMQEHLDSKTLIGYCREIKW